ncbi:MAG: HDOD domain-containing protein [Planctomycetota bacterium]
MTATGSTDSTPPKATPPTVMPPKVTPPKSTVGDSDSSAPKRLGLRIEQAKWECGLPDGARRLVASRDFEGRTNGALVRWLSADRDLAKRLLRWCNTPLYNLSTPFKNLEEASRVMENRDLARLAVLAWVRTLFLPDVRFDIYSRDFLWAHSIAVGSVASMITRTCGVGDSSNALVAGTLHDIGLCASERLDPETFQRIIREIDQLNPKQEIESEVQGWDHTQLGAAVLNHWGMPQDIVAAARYHHDPEACEDPSVRPIVASVALANYFCTRAGLGSTGSTHSVAPPPVTFEWLSVKGSLLEVLWKQVPSSIQNARDLR